MWVPSRDWQRTEEFKIITSMKINSWLVCRRFSINDVKGSRERQAVVVCVPFLAWPLASTHVCLFRQTLSFFATVGRRNAYQHCTKSLLISYWRLKGTTEVSCPNCLGPLGGTQTELTPTGHDWSLDSLAIGLMTVQLFSIVVRWQNHRQNMQRGSATFPGLFHIIPDMDTNESPGKQEVQT